MGTEVLRPQEFFVDPPPSFHRRKSHGNISNFIVNRKPFNNYNNNNNKKKIAPKPEKKKSTTESNNKKKSTGGLEMGQVTLLRRGESLGSLTSKITSKIDVSGSESSGSESPPPKQIRFDVSESPPPIRLDVSETGSNGSDSPTPKQIRFAPPPTMYAGSVCFSSPSPRSVPLPSFFNNFNRRHDEKDISVLENSGTTVLRRLLRLE